MQLGVSTKHERSCALSCQGIGSVALSTGNVRLWSLCTNIKLYCVHGSGKRALTCAKAAQSMQHDSATLRVHNGTVSCSRICISSIIIGIFCNRSPDTRRCCSIVCFITCGQTSMHQTKTVFQLTRIIQNQTIRVLICSIIEHGASAGRLTAVVDPEIVHSHAALNDSDG